MGVAQRLVYESYEHTMGPGVYLLLRSSESQVIRSCLETFPRLGYDTRVLFVIFTETG